MLQASLNPAAEKPVFGHLSEKLIGENRIGKHYFVVTKLMEVQKLKKTYETVVYYCTHPESQRQPIYTTRRICLVPFEAERLHEKGIQLAKMLNKSKGKRFKE